MEDVSLVTEQDIVGLGLWNVASYYTLPLMLKGPAYKA